MRRQVDVDESVVGNAIETPSSNAPTTAISWAGGYRSLGQRTKSAALEPDRFEPANRVLETTTDQSRLLLTQRCSSNRSGASKRQDHLTVHLLIDRQLTEVAAQGF